MEPVYFASNFFEAHLIQSFLEEHDIFSFTSSAEGSSLVGAAGYLESTHPLYVDPERADEARALIENELTAWRKRGESSDAFASEEDEAGPAAESEAAAPGRRRNRMLWYGALLLFGGYAVFHASLGWWASWERTPWGWTTSALVLLGSLALLWISWLRWGRTRS